MANVRLAERPLGEPPDGDDAAAVRQALEEGRGLSTSARVGRRFVAGGRDGVDVSGTTFQQSASSSSPSSASTRWTIVAVASAGPRPVSCRSEVNGIPETRAPR